MLTVECNMRLLIPNTNHDRGHASTDASPPRKEAIEVVKSAPAWSDFADHLMLVLKQAHQQHPDTDFSFTVDKPAPTGAKHEAI